MDRPTLLGTLVFLAACGRSPSQPPTSPTSANPWAASSVPSAPPTTFALFAEGWGLDVGDVRGAIVLYDRYLMGIARVVGDQVEPIPTDQLPHADGMRAKELFGAWPASVWVRLGYPLQDDKLRRWSGSDWAGASQHTHGTYAGNLALFSEPHGGRIEPLEPSATRDQAASRAVDPELQPLAMRTSDDGDIVVLGRVGPALEQSLAVETWPAGAQQGVVRPLPDPAPRVGNRLDATLCAGPSHRMYVVREAWVQTGTVPGPPAWKAHVIGLNEGQWTSLGEVAGQTDGFWLAGCTVAADGALWVAFANRAAQAQSLLLRLGADAQWTTVALPALPRFDALTSEPMAGTQGFAITGLHAAATGQVWVVGQRTNGPAVTEVILGGVSYVRTAVLRSGAARVGGTLSWEKLVGNALDAAGRPSAPKSSPAPAAPPASAPPPLRTAKPLVAASPGCPSVFVAFYAVQPGTPADYDFPATRSALRHQTEFASVSFVEVDLNHRRVFGALTPSFDLGQRLAQFLRGRVAGSSPQVLCGEPVIIRSVPMRIGD